MATTRQPHTPRFAAITVPKRSGATVSCTIRRLDEPGGGSASQSAPWPLVEHYVAMNKHALWNNIESHLDSCLHAWRDRVHGLGQVAAVEARSAGRTWRDDDVFKALLMAVLSANTVWSKIEAVQAELAELFCDFSLESYAERSNAEIGSRFLPWFEDRKAGSMTLARGLASLVGAAKKLLAYSRAHGTADAYFTSLLYRCEGDPKQAALRLGCGGEDKLPAFGVTLAAEALKNLGFDVAKPDRHIMRAIGSFGLVHFGSWQDARDAGNGRQPPASTSRERLLAAMAAVEEIANAEGKRVAFIDNAIWLLCAKGDGALYLTNRELAAIARRSDLPEGGRTQPECPSQGRAAHLGAMIHSWIKEDADEQRETIEHLVRALDEDRLSDRKLFAAELKVRAGEPDDRA